MNISDVSSNTGRILNHCLDLFTNETSSVEPCSFPNSAGAVSTPAKYASHPDIQFFNDVKAKYHFAYHNLKSVKAPGADPEYNFLESGSKFDPFSQANFLERLHTYTELNWSLPFFKQDQNQLTELLCSSHGWKCEASPIYNDVKNSLSCTGCGNRLVLTFNSLTEHPEYAPSTFEISDIQEVNLRLRDLYIDKIKFSSHSGSCSWRNFPSPVVGTYYPLPHISNTDEQLISRYLELLLDSHNNLAIISYYSTLLANLVPQEVLIGISDFIKMSNSWLMTRYFKEAKENLGPLLERTFPSWTYVLAVMGWELVVESFGSSSVPILSCSMCNQRVFLSSIRQQSSPIDAINTQGLDQDSSSIEDNVFKCHKSWCLYVHPFGDSSYFHYFLNMLLRSKPKIGPDGSYQNSRDDFLETMNFTEPRAKRSLDLNEDLEKFHKLRKMYFADDDMN